MTNKYLTLIALLALGEATPAIAQTNPAQAADQPARGNDIVVTATRSGDAIPTDMVGSSVTVINDQDLRDRQTRILSDVLRDVPGVAVSRLGAVGGQTQLRIRGSESRHVLVFVDGIKADDPYQGDFDFGTLLNDEASRVEVLRGQQSALYGSDAIGGVVSYSTLSGRELPGGSLRVEGGSMSTLNAGARVSGVAGDVDYALSSSYAHTNGYPVAPGGSRDLHSSLLGVSSKANWAAAPNLKITAVGRFSYTRADTDDQGVVANSPVVSGYPVGATFDTPGAYYTNKAYAGLLGAKLDLMGGAWTNSVNATISDGTRADFGSFPTGDHGRRYRGSFDSTLRFGQSAAKSRVTVALDAERELFTNTSPGGFSDNSTHRIDTIGVVGQYDFTYADRLALSASVRFDDNSRYSDDTTFRGTASYVFDGGTRLHAAYGTGVKNPLAADLFAYATGHYIGNPALQPERSKGWEAGFEQKLARGRATVGATWFDSLIFDEIATTYTLVGGQFLQMSYNDPARFHQHGLETYASARLGELRVDLAYTYLHAPQMVMALAGPAPATGNQFAVPITIQAVRRAGNIASASLTWAPKALPLTTTLTVRYNGRQNDYAFNAAFSRLIVGLKPFTLVNLNAAYDLNPRVQVFGRIENLLGARYQEVFGYATPGRAGYGGVRVKL